MTRAIFEWEGVEYEPNPKSVDWYWAIGIIATAVIVAAVLFSNYLLAVLALIAAATLALHARKSPPTHRFVLTEQGLIIGTQLHLFEHMHSFSVLEAIEGDEPPVLSIKTENWLSPHLVIPLAGVDADGVYAYLLEHITEDEHHPNLSDLVAAWLGF